MDCQIKPIQRAIEIAGSINKLADKIGCNQASIRKWICPVDTSYHNYCTAENAIKIEIATHGQVTAKQILPHLYKEKQ